MIAALNLYHIKWTEVSEIHKIKKHISVIFLTDVYADKHSRENGLHELLEYV